MYRPGQLGGSDIKMGKLADRHKQKKLFSSDEQNRPRSELQIRQTSSLLSILREVTSGPGTTHGSSCANKLTK